MMGSTWRALAAWLCLALGGGAWADEPRAVAHFVEHDGVRLHVWEKSLAPATGRPVVVLAHGSGSAGRESFDVQVPERDASLMDWLASRGFDVFAPDVRGFGRSTRPDAGVTTDQAADDLEAVVDYVRQLRAVPGVAIVAWSWGTQYAGLFAMRRPDLVTRYVSHAQMHAGSADLVRRRAQIDVYRASPYVTVPEAGWKRRFTSATPAGLNDAAIVDAFARAAAPAEPTTPTGPQLDMLIRMPMVDPARLPMPVMLIHGEHDDVADQDGLLPFFRALPNPDKRYVIIPGGGHMLHLQAGRGVFRQAVEDFLRPGDR